jgi:hypothetical protein
VDTLAETYTGRAREVIEKDVLAFLSGLAERGLIETSA